ncbi:MAG: GNAT family N-acetyltransferase [Candidatus Heimdallarchaeota archaeon]
MKIEKFTIEDYENVVQLWKKTNLTITSSDSREEVERMLKWNPEFFLICKIDEKIIGVVMGGFDGRRGYVHHLAIDPKYQRKGFGRMLIAELIKKFREKKIHKVHLFIEKRNKDVITFYQKLGWEIRNDLVMMSFIPNHNLY